MKSSQRKMLAVLAGGLVLGAGAAVTLAAWNDSEFATNTFVSGGFNLQGATDGADGTYSDHPSEGTAADLTFTMDDAQNLAPGDVVYAPFWVRLDADTTDPATFVATGADNDGGANAANLSYTVHAIAPDATCDASASSGTLVASGTDLDSFDQGTPLELTTGSGNTAGDAVQLCFAVTAGPDLVQSVATAATWSFTAESHE